MAKVQALRIDGGATFGFSLVRQKNQRPVDSTGWTVHFIAKTNNGTTVLSQSVVGDASGRFSFKWEASETALLDFVNASYNLNIEDPAGTVWRVAEGKVTYSKGV